MKDTVLKELAAKWERDAEPPNVEHTADDEQTKTANALTKGVRLGLGQCASDLKALIKLLGDGQ